jgi:hypothetical protein
MEEEEMSTINGMGPHGGGYISAPSSIQAGTTLWSDSTISRAELHPYNPTKAGVVHLHYEHIPHYTFSVRGKPVTLKETELLELVEMLADIRTMSEDFPAIQQHYVELRTLIKLHKE